MSSGIAQHTVVDVVWTIANEQEPQEVMGSACCVGDGAGQKCQARVQACTLDHLRPIMAM